MEYKLKFIQDYSVDKQEGPHYKDGEIFDAGNIASFERFIRRGVAIPANQAKAEQNTESQLQDDDLKEGTRPWLMKQLDDAGVEYKSNASKGELEELYMALGE